MKSLPLIISALIVAVAFSTGLGYIFNQSVVDQHKMESK